MTTLVRAIAALGLVFVAWLLGGSRSREEVVRAPILRQAVKHPWLTAGGLAAGAIIIGVLLLVSGVVPIKASSGQWALTAAILDFAKTRSVSTHSWGITAPPLEDEALVLRGAGHYESACLPCHGGLHRTIPPVMSAMTPTPPELTARIARWEPAELFSIVKHGIKFTGMPAWPVQRRDDEIWAMVAFLRRMPRLDAAAYRRLVYGQPDGASVPPDLPRVAEGPPPRAVRDLCWRCHGASGTGRGPGAFPSLAGQRAAYLYGSLRAFRNGDRFSGIMGEISPRLGDEEMREIAIYFERLPSREPEPSADDAAARGRAIAVGGVPERDIPACVECHGPTTLPKNPAYPRLAAQHERYLTSQLTLLQERRRGGTANVNLMHVFVNRLSRAEIQDVAHFYSTLSRGADGPPSPLR